VCDLVLWTKKSRERERRRVRERERGELKSEKQ